MIETYASPTSDTRRVCVISPKVKPTALRRPETYARPTKTCAHVLPWPRGWWGSAKRRASHTARIPRCHRPEAHLASS